MTVPLVAWDEQTFRAMYSAHDGHRWHTYGPGYFALMADPPFERRARWLIDHLTGRVLVVGAAFGYLCAQLKRHGVTSMGCDSSAFVAAHQDEHAATVLYADVRQLVASDVPDLDWVVTESVLESYDATEARSIITACHELAPNVAHLVYTNLRPPFRNKPLGQWKRDDPAAIWDDLSDRG